MAVVINEFEVLDNPPAPRSLDGEATNPPPAAPALDTEDLRQLLAAVAQMQLRRFAH